MSLPDGHEFALCLTHDVDRPYKTGFHALYYAVRDRDPSHLRDLFGDGNPYWQFDDLASLEADLGVRSAWYFLTERRPSELPTRTLLDPATLVQQLGRYDVAWPDVAAVARDLDAGGWEVGIHGSYHTATDRGRLAYEKAKIEGVLDHPVRGGRQHYLRLERPVTWRHYADVGLAYDASLGSTTTYGFQHGYDVRYPFDDEFAVFPLTLMEQTLPDPETSYAAAREVCESLLAEAAANDAVMSALWHPRYCNEREFPGYRRLYEFLIERALEMGAWVGPPGNLCAGSAEEERARDCAETV